MGSYFANGGVCQSGVRSWMEVEIKIYNCPFFLSNAVTIFCLCNFCFLSWLISTMSFIILTYVSILYASSQVSEKG